MFRIVEKKALNQSVKLMKVYAPYIARKAQPGQFIILRVSEGGERIPLTIADFDRLEGTVTIIVQEIGKTTKHLGSLEEGDQILDFIGPLGNPTHFGPDVKKAVVIGGGVGAAIAFPQAKKLHGDGIEVDAIIGFRNSGLIILEKEMRQVSTRLFVTTDDGSNGNKGFVSDVLNKLLLEGSRYDVAFVVGPLIMMKIVSGITQKYAINTIVSMNPVMIDGTGMCGGCRLTVGGRTRFACVDGPDFDGHQVDFDEAMRRQLMYRNEEDLTKDHTCRIGGVSGAEHVSE